MSLERLREWYSDHPYHRADKAAARRRAIATRAADASRPLDELHAEALEENAARARPRRKEPDYNAEMRLPEGKTCGDCWHLKRCLALGYTKSETRTGCDFHPRRFVDAGFTNEGWRQAALSVVHERFSA